MQKTIRTESIINIQKVTLIFFIVTGILHFGSSLLIKNQIFLKESTILNKTIDIPFIITGLTYALTSFRIGITQHHQKHKILDILIAIIILIALIGLVAVNVLMSDIA